MRTEGSLRAKGERRRHRERESGTKGMKNGELSGEYWRENRALSVLPWPQRIGLCKCTHKDTRLWSIAQLHLQLHHKHIQKYLQSMRSLTDVQRCNSGARFTCLKPSRARKTDFYPIFYFCFSISFPTSPCPHPSFYIVFGLSSPFFSLPLLLTDLWFLHTFLKASLMPLSNVQHVPGRALNWHIHLICV